MNFVYSLYLFIQFSECESMNIWIGLRWRGYDAACGNDYSLCMGELTVFICHYGYRRTFSALEKERCALMVMIPDILPLVGGEVSRSEDLHRGCACPSWVQMRRSLGGARDSLLG